ncbi:MAG: GldG family protein [Sphingomonadaceae bacterium]|nr:GldG family protein [Sphingomonadaceae bacterium]
MTSEARADRCAGLLQRFVQVLIRPTIRPMFLPALLVLTGCGDAAEVPGEVVRDERRAIALSTSLPIIWREAADISGILADDGPPHWALEILRDYGELRPLDSLSDPSGALPLDGDTLLVMAQPYPLAPQENVALDDWVRKGGRLLLFADPMLTHHSSFALGDRRRPQDIALLSPILKRWGIALQFEEDQPGGEREMALGSGWIPVNLPGRFVLQEGNEACSVEASGLLAICQIGRGLVVLVADAALFEDMPDSGSNGPAFHARQAALRLLLDRVLM